MLLHEEPTTIKVIGNTHGLGAFPLRRLERLTSRKVRSECLVTPEFARALTEISRDIERQIGVLIDRRGHIRVVMVGDAHSILLPDLSDFRQGRTRLCGLRLVHTHLNHEPLSDEDLTDLALLRLDSVAAIEVHDTGLPGQVFEAHLLPDNPSEQPWDVLDPQCVHALGDDFLARVAALEGEFSRKQKPRRAGDNRDRAILVNVSTEATAIIEDSLDELNELARSAGIDVVHRIIQRRPIDPRSVMGKGKLQSTVIKAMQLGAEMLVFDMNLNPSQVQSLANGTDLKILDRTQVILDIFAQHAQTREGKIQVELAQLRYMLPRLGAKQAASAFSRLTGGIGGRGPGETKLEIDRRRAQDRIALLEREIKKLGDRRKLRRSRRTKNELPIVSIIGYTNVGKSTLLNRLTHSEVVAEDALFATLNPVSRRLRFPREREIIITDTVGFIRHLPKELMAAFRTTLEELDEADLLLHLIDASSPHVDEHYEVVQDLLSELGLSEKKTIVAINKIDVCPPEQVDGLSVRYGGIPLCAFDSSTFGPLLDVMSRLLWPDWGGCIDGLGCYDGACVENEERGYEVGSSWQRV